MFWQEMDILLIHDQILMYAGISSFTLKLGTIPFFAGTENYLPRIH